MKISEMIEELKKRQETYGDLEVVVWHGKNGEGDVFCKTHRVEDWHYATQTDPYIVVS